MVISVREFDKSIIKYPNVKRFPGGASNDLRPNLQDPSNPVPAMDPNNLPHIGGGRRLGDRNATRGDVLIGTLRRF